MTPLINLQEVSLMNFSLLSILKREYSCSWSVLDPIIFLFYIYYFNQVYLLLIIRSFEAITSHNYHTNDCNYCQGRSNKQIYSMSTICSDCNSIEVDILWHIVRIACFHLPIFIYELSTTTAIVAISYSITI
jgi:hypothetical protein